MSQGYNSPPAMLTAPPLDHECAVVLAQLRGRVPLAISPETLSAVRATLASPDATPSEVELRREGAFTVEERQIPSAEDTFEVSLLICRPALRGGPAPAIYFIHGGGMVTGNNRLGVLEVLDWAQELGLIVVSVEYRLAPEHPYPTPIADCYTGLLWMIEHSDELGIDADRVIIAGQSAGGGLAASLALLVRDRQGPALAGQLLMCPMLDDRNDSVSVRQMSGLGVWDQISNRTGWSALLGGLSGAPDVSPYAAAARAVDLSGLPPAFIDVGSAEIFRDECVNYANGLWLAGGAAELHVWAGGFHGYATVAPEAEVSHETRRSRVRWLTRLLT